MTKFLVDENIPPHVVAYWRDEGLDVKEVRELRMPAASDATIMDLARREKRALLTFDRHFANILLYPLSSHYGVVRIRIHPPLLSDIIQALKQFLRKFDLETIRGSLIILERDGFRVRRGF